MSILVTGGAGYIGSHTVRALESRGQEVVVLDSLEKGHRQAVPNSPLVEGDLGDASLLDTVFRDFSVNAVVHFAAHSLVGESVKRPDIYFKNNVGCLFTLLDTMRNHSVDRLVFSSTAAVYGEPKEIPIPECHPKTPENPYGESKLFAETILRRHSEAFGLRYIALRYFNAAGADPAGGIGEDHTPESHLIPLVLQTLLGQRPHIEIFGTDYPTPDGTCIRDYVHVNDLSDAHILSLDALSAGAPSTAYNLGNGRGFSVREVIHAAEKVTQQTVPVLSGQRRPGDPAILVASSEKIQEELRWKPKFPDLAAIIETAWDWHRSHPNGFRSREAKHGKGGPRS